MKHKRKLRVRRHDKPTSIDEQIADTFEDILVLLDEVEDEGLRELWRDAISDFTHSGNVSRLVEVCKWRRAVVPLDEFIFGETYLSQLEADIYPGVWQALQDLDTDQYDEAILKGALGIGKSTLANLATARDLYKISCMADPQATYGIARGSPIVFTMQSVRLSTAKKVVFTEFGRYVRNSPYFKTMYPYDKYVTSMMIFPEHNVTIMPLSSANSAAISMNVIAGQLDEANFMEKNMKSKSSMADADGVFDQAKNLYNTLASRRKSRFLKRENLPGTLFVISSSKFPDDFTELKARDAAQYGGPDDKMYVFEGSQWDIKGRENRDFFDEEEFTVQIGNETFPSKVIPRNDETGEDLEPVAPGCDSIRVPLNLRVDFERDCDGCIRDFAGLTTQATHPFITQRNKIAEANELAELYGYKNPIPVETVCLSLAMPSVDLTALRTDIDMPRHAHIDLAISGDGCGVAIGHIAGWKVEKVAATNSISILPIVAMDILLQVTAPVGGEIELADIRTLLISLRDVYGLNIESVTFDQFQSVDSRQILKKKGFAAGYRSVEGVEEYRTYREALYGGRLLQYQHEVANRELAQVESSKKGNKEKVDHRPNGSKDVADAAVGVVSFLLSRKSNWLPSDIVGTEPGMYLIGASTKADVDNVITSSDDADIDKEIARVRSRRKVTRRRSLRRRK